MCGIFAFFDNSAIGFVEGDMKTINGLYNLTSLRGRDSTSMIGLNKNTPQTNVIHKVMGGPENLFKGKNGKKLRSLVTTKFHGIIGHGRKATVGSINIQNAHPFVWKNIALVHNGTYIKASKKELDELADKNGVDISGTTTDSEVLTRLIAEIGPEKTLSHCHGAYALIWHDISDGYVYFCRNSQRPLSFLSGNNSGPIVIASEQATLKWVKDYSNISGNIEQVIVNTLYRINVKKPQNIEKVGKIPFVTSSYGATNGWNGYNNGFPSYDGQYENDYINDTIDEEKSGGVFNIKGVNNKNESVYEKVNRLCLPGNKIFFRISEEGMGFNTLNTSNPDHDYSSCINGDSPLYDNVQIRSFGSGKLTESIKKKHKAGVLYKGEIERVIECKTFMTRTGKNYYARIIVKMDTIEQVPENENQQYNYIVLANNKSVTEEEFNRVVEQGCSWCKIPLIREQSKSLYLLKNGSLICPECSIHVLDKNI